MSENIRVAWVVLWKAFYWTLLAGAVSNVGPKLAWLWAVTR